MRFKKTTRKRLGEILVEKGALGESSLTRALESQAEVGLRLGEILVAQGVCTEEEIASALAGQLGLPLVDLKSGPIEPAILEMIPEALARKHVAVAVGLEKGALRIAMADPLDVGALSDIEFACAHTILPGVATKTDILRVIDKNGKFDDSVEQIMKDITATTPVEVLDESRAGRPDVTDLRRQGEAAPVIRMVNHIITQAVQMKASDIHMEPTPTSMTIRFRVDGRLRLGMDLPKWLQAAVTSRAKLIGRMDIAEKRVPQDGRFAVRIAGTKIDVRCSTLPTNYGEKIVMRILDQHQAPVAIDDLGFDERQKEAFLTLISKPQGILLVTGPTGSGKTTTLYGALSRVRAVDKNISTVEDPIEYELEGVNQVAIREKAGLTFPSVLRSLLRQDPDVIMIGEIRDEETATIAMRAALTGHLVLSTVHTNSTVETITRLRNLGIPSYLISSTIIGIVAQRLVRRVCPSCAEPSVPAPESLHRVGITPDQAKEMRFYAGRGCARCGQTGSHGRLAVHELLLVTPRIRDTISRDGTEGAIRVQAVTEGMKTMAARGLELVSGGLTTLDELLRVVQIEDEFGASCPSCGARTSSDFVACPRCGTRLQIACPTCRCALSPEWAFCPYCAGAARPSAKGGSLPDGSVVEAR